MTNSVIIYCDHLLYPSETFIQAQADALTRYKADYAGIRRVDGLSLTASRVHLVNNGGIHGAFSEIAYKLLATAPQFTKHLSKVKPVLIHAHFGADGLRILPFAKKLGIPLLVTFHGSDATATVTKTHRVPYGHQRYLKRMKELQEGACHFIAVSEFIRGKLLAQGYPEGKVTQHYIGVDVSSFTPTDTEPEPVVLFVGRLTERKGVEYLIRAMAEVQKVRSDLELVIIGDGHLRRSLESLAASTLARYRFLGVQSPEDVRGWMRRSMIFAAPSIRSDWGEEEGLGMVFLEAQAVERPVVSFNSGGIREAVHDGVTGFLAAERDCETLARNILLLAKDRELRLRMGRAGRRHVAERFNLLRQTQRLEEIYAKVIEDFKATGKAVHTTSGVS